MLMNLSLGLLVGSVILGVVVGLSRAVGFRRTPLALAPVKVRTRR
jgi:hypothetical protein